MGGETPENTPSRTFTNSAAPPLSGLEQFTVASLLRWGEGFGPGGMNYAGTKNKKPAPLCLR